MQRRIEIIEDHSDLYRTVWVFSYPDRFYFCGAILNEWRDETRKTKRHKFRASQLEKTAWHHLFEWENRIPRPDVPERIKALALERFAASLRFADGE